MATYGLGTAGQVSFTGYSNTLGAGSAANSAATTWLCGSSMVSSRVMATSHRLFRNGGGTIASTRLLYTLLGAGSWTNRSPDQETSAVDAGITGWVDPD